jgi:phage-related protein
MLTPVSAVRLGSMSGRYAPRHQQVPIVIHSRTSVKGAPRLSVRFFRETTGREPVREWLKALASEEKREIGADINTVQFGWPIGMPVVDHLDGDIWEVRTRMATRIARVLFAVEGDVMVLLHGFIKKEQKTPKAELDLAKRRLKKLRSAR